jgi:hypothetical protein
MITDYLLDILIVSAFIVGMIKFNFGVLKMPVLLLLCTALIAELSGLGAMAHLVFAGTFAVGYIMQKRRSLFVLAPYLIMVTYQIFYAIYDYSTIYAGFIYYAHPYVVTFIYSLFLYSSYRYRFVRDSINSNDNHRRAISEGYSATIPHEKSAEKGGEA